MNMHQDLTCTICAKTFSSRYNLKKHSKFIHSDTGEINSTCYVCDTVYLSKYNLEKHIRTWHQKNTNQQKCSGTFQCMHCEKIFSTKRSLRQHCYVHTKSKIRKMSRIICPIDNCLKIFSLHSELRMHATLEHNYSGERQLVEYDNLQGKLKMGISHKRIINDIRQSEIPQELQRIHLIEKKDLHNITKSFNIDHPMKCHENDFISVTLYVQRMQKTTHNPVLYFKHQGEEDLEFNKNDFCLILMTKFQMAQIQQFGSDRLCVDGTHGLNKYDFYLYTLLVVNEFQHGVPVAFCFTNRSDTYAYAHFFKCVQKEAGLVNPSVFMSDDEPAFYNAWCSVMGPVKNQLLCAWHILRNWRHNLSKIKTEDKKKIVFKTLQTLLREPNEGRFEAGLDVILSDLINDSDTTCITSL